LAGLAYFPFYPGDWLGDARVSALTLEEQGAYFALLCRMWNYRSGVCRLPNDDAQLAMMLGVSRRKWAKLRRALIDRKDAVLVLAADGDWVTSPRLEAEYQKAVDKSRKAAMAAKQKSGRRADAERTQIERRSNADRTQSGRSANGLPPIEPEPYLDSGSPSLGGSRATSEVRDTLVEAGSASTGVVPSNGQATPSRPRSPLGHRAHAGPYSDDFERVWQLYPRKADKGRAYRAYQARLREGFSADDLLAAAGHYAEWARSMGKDTTFLKLGATFFGPDRPCAEWIHGPPEGMLRRSNGPIGGVSEWHEDEPDLITVLREKRGQ
jgi:uncharacterized protein YdaU (DUF1376 family)